MEIMQALQVLPKEPPLWTSRPHPVFGIVGMAIRPAIL